MATPAAADKRKTFDLSHDFVELTWAHAQKIGMGRKSFQSLTAPAGVETIEGFAGCSDVDLQIVKRAASGDVWGKACALHSTTTDAGAVEGCRAGQGGRAAAHRHPHQAPLALADDRGLEAGVAVAWHLQFDRADLGQHCLGAGAVAGVAAVAAGRVAVGVAEMVGELAIQDALQDQLGELLQQLVRADQADALRAGLVDQPRSQLGVDRVGLRPAEF